ncbi:hypothetical protein GR212_15840 [Rhizobium lusitanum]|uniref:RecT family protein n=1 Tax=Rhizobium lusitanum TaxID=293958 RepID=A0A6L9U6C7_9HYPH|nr:hypothetical protein [Rhizobium lusitanum]NEI71051.1 hypothetical protein [Rhizobium lusitanum]
MTNEIAGYAAVGNDDDTFLPATVFDTERFEQVMRVADIMARATTIPDHLKSKAGDPTERFEETRGNCFMICNQSSHWGMDPFAVAQATAFVYGKICYEGKLIRAVIKKKLGFDLHYAFFGDAGNMQRTVFVSDKPFVSSDGVPLSKAEIEDLCELPGNRITVGTLEKWHSKSKGGGVNDNWRLDEDKMFRERGSREWCRQWAPGLMLGVYSPDEFDDVESTSRSNRARDITPSNPLLEDAGAVAMERFDRQTGEIVDQKGGTQPASAKSVSRSETSAKSGSTASDPNSSRSASNSSSHPSSNGGDDAAGGGASPRASAGTFTEFSMALLRFGGTGNGRDADMQKLSSASDQFWANGKPSHRADVALSKAIIAAHLKRMNGEITADALKQEVSKIIDGSFNGL